MADKLSIKEQKFIDAYLASNNISQSMIAAGYSAKSASAAGNRMLKKVKIAKVVEAAKAKTAQKVEWSREDSLKALIAIHKDAIKPSDKVAALKEVNVMCGYNAPQKVEHSGSLTQIQRIIKK